MSLLLLLRPKYPRPTGGLPRGRNNIPSLDFSKQDKQLAARRLDDDDVLLLVAL